MPAADGPRAIPRIDLRRLLLRFGLGYYLMLPGAFLTAFFYVVVAGRAWTKGGPLLSVPFWFLGASLLVAGAARALDLTDRPLVRFAWERTNAFVLSGILYWIGIFVYMVAWMIPLRLVFGPLDGWGPWADRSFHVVLAVSVWLLSRLWPALACKFIYRGAMSPPHHRWGRIWQGPGLGGAFRMTSRPGAFLRATVPVALIGIGPGVALGQLREWLPAEAAGWLTAVIHLVGVPWGLFVLVERAAALRLESEPWVDAGEPPELERTSRLAATREPATDLRR